MDFPILGMAEGPKIKSAMASIIKSSGNPMVGKKIHFLPKLI